MVAFFLNAGNSTTDTGTVQGAFVAIRFWLLFRMARLAFRRQASNSLMMDNAKLTELFVSHTEAVNTLWGFLSTVALAILAFLYKDGQPVGKTPLKLVLTIGFLFFAAGNWTAMCREQSILYTI